MIQFLGLSKSFSSPGGEVTVLDQVDTVFSSGAMTALMGPSGTGKSTIVRMVAGLDEPTQGRILIHGDDVTALGRADRSRYRLKHIGVVFQEHLLIPELTLLENAALPLRGQGRKRTSALGEAQEALERFGIGDLSGRRPAEVSGGQQQRAGIARAIVGGRSVILADEPTGALDKSSTRMVFEALKAAADEGLTVVTVTHDPSVREWAHTVKTLDDGRLWEES